MGVKIEDLLMAAEAAEKRANEAGQGLHEARVASMAHQAALKNAVSDLAADAARAVKPHFDSYDAYGFERSGDQMKMKVACYDEDNAHPQDVIDVSLPLNAVCMLKAKNEAANDADSVKSPGLPRMRP